MATRQMRKKGQTDWRAAFRRSMRRAAQMGIGITTIPDYIVGADTNLVMISLDVDPPEFDTYLAYAEEMRASKRVAVFRDFLISKSRKWSF